MPLVQQEWNIYRSRAIGTWLEENNVEVIPNIRWSDSRTYHTCTLGIKENSTIAIGTHGIVKKNEERHYLIEGLDYVVDKLKPQNIIVDGKILHKNLVEAILNKEPVEIKDTPFGTKYVYKVKLVSKDHKSTANVIVVYQKDTGKDKLRIITLYPDEK